MAANKPTELERIQAQTFLDSLLKQAPAAQPVSTGKPNANPAQPSPPRNASTLPAAPHLPPNHIPPNSAPPSLKPLAGPGSDDADSHIPDDINLDDPNIGNAIFTSASLLPSPTVAGKNRELQLAKQNSDPAKKALTQSLLTQSQNATNTIRSEMHTTIIEISNQVSYRQSIINDYLTCPQMAMFRWIMGLPQPKAWAAAFLGTAGHKVIEVMHRERNYEMTMQDIHDIFAPTYDEAVIRHLDETNQPHEAVMNFRDGLSANLHDYTEYLKLYQKDERNRTFHPTIIEQDFVLIVYDEEGKPYVFTGTIDQAGYKLDGRFVMRDIKFKAKSFRPSYLESYLSTQLGLYSYALINGNPCCKTCRPKHVSNGNSLRLEYHGPCRKCQAKIGTAAWPRYIPVETSYIWMKEYGVRQKDEHSRFIPHPEKKKAINPETGRLKIIEIQNPLWAEGYKKGDPGKDPFITTPRTLESLTVTMADLMTIASQFSSGKFYRRPGDACNNFCPYTQECRDAIDSKVAEVDQQKWVAAAIEANDNPFTDES